MTLSFIIFAAIAGVIIFGPGLLKRRPSDKRGPKSETPKTRDLTPFIMKLIGGPADGHIEKIVEPERPLFFVATYPPKVDEYTGMPPEENIVGHMYGKVYIRPNYAYYRFVMDDEYIYVRDLEEKEVQNIAITGEQPEVVPRGYNGGEEE